MSITPKNWKSFQHYKERTPAWIKLHKGLLTDFTFNRLPLASRALAPMLWLLASEYEEGEITASMEEIAFRLHVNEADLREALSPLIDSGFFVSSELLAKPEQTASLEKRREENKIEENIVAKAPIGNSDFAKLKQAYPKRAGNYGWKAAEKKFNSLVKTGVDPAVIIAAAVRLCQTLRSKIGTEFIPMPASWLNSEDFAESAADAFVAHVPAKGYYAAFDSPQLDAWDKHNRSLTGRLLPRDVRGGWQVDSEWPPGYTPLETIDRDAPSVALRSMQ